MAEDSAGADSRSAFVTTFDKNYAARGLSLIASMDRLKLDYSLLVVALDSYVERLFELIEAPRVRVIPLADVENASLLRVKNTRSRTEYYWTLTPFVIDLALRHHSIDSVATYLDADTWFLSSPARLLASFKQSTADVLITEHGYHAAFDQSKTSGRFCVQFLAARGGSSDDIINRWKAQCLEWCFAEPLDGRIGDQGYLTEWPELYGSRASIVTPASAFQGPWNALRFPFSEAVAYHFHGLKRIGKGQIGLGAYPIPKPHRDEVYRHYGDDLDNSEALIRSVGLKVFGRARKRELIRDFRSRISRFRQLWTTH